MRPFDRGSLQLFVENDNERTGNAAGVGRPPHLALPGLWPRSPFRGGRGRKGLRLHKRRGGDAAGGVAAPEPTVRLPRPDDSDIPELADFPTDIPVNPVPKRPPVRDAEKLENQELSDNEQGNVISE